MRYMGLNEIREKFLMFFEEKGHLRLPSFSLVPNNDKSLLLINAGMTPLKTYFTGQETPPRRRVVTCQKCVRTGDIENVGKTARHGTFFEMLGNFSFGDYFKKEAITWGWEFLTQVMELPADKLYITVYLDDDEAFDIWTKDVGAPPERVTRMGKADNFWEHGVGPCGPCSEIHIDRGEEYGCGKDTCGIGCDCDRYMEIWNLVFTQFNREEDGTYTPLAFPNIDTGMGLERLAGVMQNVNSIFDIDAIRFIRDAICGLTRKTYGANHKDDISIRIITDHIRSIVFMMSDGVTPSNEGRGYVLRRLLRRAARHGKLLGINEAFLARLADKVTEASRAAYPELAEKSDFIKAAIALEENRFSETIDQGLEVLRGHMEHIKKQDADRVLSGALAFQLYDTFGFPMELMKEILEEEDIAIAEEEFELEMKRQRERARAARAKTTYMGSDETVYHKLDVNLRTEFVGYDACEVSDAMVLAVIKNGGIVDAAETSDDDVSIILDKTPFYAESGGQKGDRGVISADTGAFAVNDVIKVIGGRISHIGKVTSGSIEADTTAHAAIDKQRRDDTRRNHSATHLLQKALRDVLGGHVEQKGSEVSAERLRFDFTHFSPVSPEDLNRVESIVNEKILEALPINISEKPVDEARKMGAMALFGEKYGQTARVVDMSGYSIELCGGTHLSNTMQAGSFKILSESGVAAGIRRIEAITGRAALAYYRDSENKLRRIAEALKTSENTIVQRIHGLQSELKGVRAELEKLSAKLSGNAVDDILAGRETIGSFNVLTGRAEGLDANALRGLNDKLRDKLSAKENNVVILVSLLPDKAAFLIYASDAAVAAGAHAGNLVKAAAEVCGGGGGGKPGMAQAGGRDVSKVEKAVETIKDMIRGT
ncbi:MAG: alanine--tRNA ligase [Clostridiales bacterium]|jgi:alanyl-tRNA synthetase|nr:alanine--tRNA ligase [Clostridiales bacterium]